MKRYQLGMGTIVLGGCFAFSSCGDMSKPLAGGGMLMSPALAPGGIGRSSAGLYGGRNFHSVHLGEASAMQKRMAEKQAQQALASSKVKNRIEKQKITYVAVPVRGEKGQKGGGTTVMKVNAATGVPTGEVYATKGEGTVKDGDTIKLGGDPTLYFATTGSKL